MGKKCFYCIFALFCILIPVSVESQSFVYQGCSQELYTDDSDYQSNVNSLLGSLLSQASNTFYYNTSVGSGGSDTVYGLFQCRGDLNSRDCPACIRSAGNQIVKVCGKTRGAKVQLEGCFLHYDRINFFGLMDNTFIYKTCNPQLGTDGDFYKHLNEVLTNLQQGNVGGTGFRVSNAGDSRTGSVYGLAQCEGDLAQSDCATCVTAAVQKLKDSCGNAVTGQVYLSKCFARYAQDVFYGHPSSTDPDDDDDDDDNDDDAGRTIAIIIGLLAGVALIVVFISFLRMLFRKHDG
eukprot:Gb_10508 [translate_table: standard]